MPKFFRDLIIGIGAFILLMIVLPIFDGQKPGAYFEGIQLMLANYGIVPYPTKYLEKESIKLVNKKLVESSIDCKCINISLVRQSKYQYQGVVYFSSSKKNTSVTLTVNFDKLLLSFDNPNDLIIICH